MPGLSENTALKWDSVYGLDKDPIREFLVHPYLLEVSGNLRNKKILDIGCGNGNWIKKILPFGPTQVCGIEINDEFLRYLKEHIKSRKIEIFKGDIRKKFPYEDRRFDITYLIFVLNEVDDIRAVMKEAARTLKKGGRLLLMAIHPFYPMRYYLYERYTGKKNDKIIGVGNYFERFKGDYMLTIANKPTPFFHHTVEDLISSILDNGLGITGFKELTVNNQIIEAYPRYSGQKDLPKFLFIEAEK